MLSFIKGQLSEVFEDSIVVENNGIGFNIRVPATVISQLPPVGENVKIYTHLHVREDAMTVFGFFTKDDLAIFRLLINVNGIGPKGALAILSTISPDDLRFAVLSNDVKTISSAPGIGAKTAQRLIIELKDKLSLEDTFNHSLESKNASVVSSAKNEAVEALTALGYSGAEALKAVKMIDNAETMDSEELLRAALKKMAKF